MPAPTLGHVLLSAPIFGVAWAAGFYFGPHWAAAVAVALYWLGRELAQSFRPSTMRLVWTWQSSRNFGAPAAAALALAALIQALPFFFA